MAEYGIVVGISIFINIFLRKIGTKSAYIVKWTLGFFFLSYMMLLGAKDISVGADTFNYVTSYRMMEGMNWEAINSSFYFEPGFLYLCAFLSMLGSERLLLVVAAILIVIPVMYLYQHESKEALICISFFLISLLFEMFFSGLRQSIAISLTVPAYYFARKKKLVCFLLMIGLAASFHISAIVASLLYPIYHMQFTKKWLWVILPSFGMIYVFRDTLMTYVFLLAGDTYNDRYSYLSGESGQMALMVLFVLLTIYAYFMLDEGQMDVDDIGLRNILLLATGIHLFTPLNPTISRINYYFILFIPLLLSRIPQKCYPGLKSVAYIGNGVMIVFFITYFFFLKADSLQVFQYQFFFE